MLRFEIKKVLARTSNRMALGLLLFILVFVSHLALSSPDVTFTNDNGDSESGIGAARQLKAVKEQWKGPLTTEKLKQVIAENNRINATQEAKSEDVRQQDIAYARTQGYADIRDLVSLSYRSVGEEYDYFKLDSLDPKAAKDFYRNRTAYLKEWLDTEAKDQFSQAEKSYLTERYETLKTPLEYGYAEGWKQFCDNSPMLIMLMILILGFLVSGIFSGEFSQKTDAVFFSACHGRGKAVMAKVKAGLLLVTAVYFIVMLLYSIVVLGVLGAGGANLPIQSGWHDWESIYHLTFLQKYVLVLAGGYLGSLFVTLLTMLVSAKSRSAVVAVIVPFAVSFLPMFLSANLPDLDKALGLFPDRLLQLDDAIASLNVYQVGGMVAGAVTLLFILYFVLSAALCPIVYQAYKRAEVK